MNPNFTYWIEIIKALGPYTVAIIAIGASFVTAYLAQRNWQKQFAAQQSVSLLDKRVDIATRLPSKLFELSGHCSLFSLKARLSEGINLANSNGRQYPDATINSFLDGQGEATKAIQDTNFEVQNLRMLVRAFFNEEIKKETSDCYYLIEQLSDQNFASLVRPDLERCVLAGKTREEILSNMTAAIRKHLQLIEKDINHRIENLASLMVKYAKNEQVK